MSDPTQPDKDVVAKYVELQSQTPCRKCKKTDWTLEPTFTVARGGTRVGIFVVLGTSAEEVDVGAFVCKGCGNRFERPFYSRQQLAAQEHPAVTLDVRIEKSPQKKQDRNGH